MTKATGDLGPHRDAESPPCLPLKLKAKGRVCEQGAGQHKGLFPGSSVSLGPIFSCLLSKWKYYLPFLGTEPALAYSQYIMTYYKWEQCLFFFNVM